MGKYIYLFQTKEEFNTARENAINPWVSYTEKEKKVDYNKKNYLTFEAMEDESSLYFVCPREDGNNVTIEVSTDRGLTWEEKTSTFNEGIGICIADSLNIGDTIMVRGNGPTGFWYEDCYLGNYFYGSSNFYVYGNVMSLLDEYNFDTLDEVPDGAFAMLFRAFNGQDPGWIYSHPNKELLLPATKLGISCYEEMFEECIHITRAPKLPAITLVESCYRMMFYETGLTETPELPATVLAESCYESMFESCTHLVTAKDLCATTLAKKCCQDMFKGCTKLKAAPKLPATKMEQECYMYMFENCTSLTVAPKLPSMELSALCYFSMFLGCSSLETAPELPATVLASECYHNMFAYCTKLNYVKALFIDTEGLEYPITNWLEEVSETGTFVKNSNATWNITGQSGIPSGWTVQTASA